MLNLSEDEKRDRLRCADSEDASVVKFVVGDVANGHCHNYLFVRHDNKLNTS